jgi:hypothetical protein
MDPGDPSNRRITLIVKYLEQNGSEGDATALPAPAAQDNKTSGTAAPAQSPAKK